MNSILPDLISDGGESKVVLLGSTAEEFLTAVFRGGGERIQYVYQLLKHLAISFPEYSDLIAKVERDSGDTVDLFARLTLITYAVQRKAFSRLSVILPERNRVACSYDELLHNSETCIARASKTLGLELSADDIRASILQNFSNHSKVTDREYIENDMQAVNSKVASLYGVSFNKVFDWFEGEQQLQHYY